MIRYRVVISHPDEPRSFQCFSDSLQEAQAIFDQQVGKARSGSVGRIIETTESVIQQEQKS